MGIGGVRTGDIRGVSFSMDWSSPFSFSIIEERAAVWTLSKLLVIPLACMMGYDNVTGLGWTLSGI